LLRLQLALYSAVACCLEQLPEGGALRLLPVRDAGRPSLEFSGEAEGEAVSLAPAEAAGWNQLAAVLDKLGASVERAEAGFRLTLSGDAG
jgi:hypothetical protein